MLSSLIGIIASSGGAAVGDYESIATINGTGASGSITFTSIPSTYQHLQIRFFGFSSTAGNLNVRFNSDNGSNYAYHQLTGDGATAAAATSSVTLMFAGYMTATQYGVGVIDILDYDDTNKYKTLRSLHGSDANGSGFVIFRSGLWQNTNAITSITINSPSASNFTTDSSFALYGIKG